MEKPIFKVSLIFDAEREDALRWEKVIADVYRQMGFEGSARVEVERHAPPGNCWSVVSTYQIQVKSAGVI